MRNIIKACMPERHKPNVSILDQKEVALFLIEACQRILLILVCQYVSVTEIFFKISHKHQFYMHVAYI